MTPKKRPYVSLILATKTARPSLVEFMKERPSWRVSQLEMCDPYGWHELDAAAVAEIKNRLRSFESMTWSEILVRDREENHRIQVQDICAKARERLISIRQDDIDHLVSLRVTGRRRMWGIEDGSVLKLLWWDPEHEICPAPKKGT